ncbi:hypothetical protein JOE11_004967 [Robbsia andropogonis]
MFLPVGYLIKQTELHSIRQAGEVQLCCTSFRGMVSAYNIFTRANFAPKSIFSQPTCSERLVST